MRILFYFGHPSQYLFLRKSMEKLESNGNEIKILIKSKDVLENLLKADGFSYINILPEIRKKSKLFIFISLIKRIIIMFPIFLRYKPDLVIATDPSVAHIGKLFGIGRITVLEDDYEIIKKLAKLTFPFTQTILCPEICKVGNWNEKKVGYFGYMKLGYLHPNVFTFDKSIIKKYKISEKYVIIRLSQLSAYHDVGINGISETLLNRLIYYFENKSFQVLISSEGLMDKRYNEYKLEINPNDIHHILAGSSFLIGDSQSMTVEAAMLGIPSIRISSFAGRISVLEELEHKYKLTFAINPTKIEEVFLKLDRILRKSNLKDQFQLRKKRMLQDKIDVTAFLVWFIENYPNSVLVMKKNPNFQFKFR